MQVSGRQVGSCCLEYELKGASLATGKQLRGLSSPNTSQFLRLPASSSTTYRNGMYLRVEPWHVRGCACADIYGLKLLNETNLSAAFCGLPSSGRSTLAPQHV